MTLRALLVLVVLACPAAVSARGASTAPRPVRAHAVHPPAAPGRGTAATRTLDPTRIEGELPVPQVLFITAREPRRFLDFQAGRWLRSSRALAAAAPDSGAVVVLPTPITPTEETHR